MLGTDGSERQLLEQFLESLKELPKVQAKLGRLCIPKPAWGVDAQVELRVGDRLPP